MDIREKTQRIIDKERTRLTKERDKYKRKMRETMSYYGVGGPYRRQEVAKEKRERELGELEDFESQLKRTTKHIETRVYVFGCKKCGTACMTTRKPFEKWHECPTCRGMIYLDDIKQKTIQIAENGETWQEMLKEALEEE